MKHRTRSILFIMRTIIRAKANLWSLDTKGRIVGVKKEIRISIEEHPIPVRRIKQRRIYVSFADGASLDGDVVLSTGLAVVPGVAAGNTQTFTGKVSDAMCGAKHTEGGIAPAACVRVCVQKGAKYALVVGDKVYT